MVIFQEVTAGFMNANSTVIFHEGKKKKKFYRSNWRTFMKIEEHPFSNRNEDLRSPQKY